MPPGGGGGGGGMLSSTSMSTSPAVYSSWVHSQRQVHSSQAFKTPTATHKQGTEQACENIACSAMQTCMCHMSDVAG